jgi:lipid-binding SYLF domain-containing protein
MNSTLCLALMMTVVAGLLVSCATAPASHADNDALRAEATATMQQLRTEEPGVGGLVQRGYGYALFPTVTKGGLVVGGAHGRGVVYERGQHIGYSELTQGSVGAQLGAETFSELLVFENKDALDRFTAGQLNFAADASAVVLKTGVATDIPFVNGVAVVVHPTGGAMVEASIGGQRFTYQPK